MSILFALSSAAGYGTADFFGGLAARRRSALTVTAVAQAAGTTLLLPAAFVVPGRLSAAALGFGTLAALAGTSGLLLYLRGLAMGPMGLVAPLSAVVGAALPLVAGVLDGERPGTVARVALVVALAAIVLASAGTRGNAPAGMGLVFGLGAGVGFGLFFIAIAAFPDTAGLWPLVAARVTSAGTLGAVALGRRRPAPIGDIRLTGLSMMALSGVLDTLATVLFFLAMRTGALSISGVLVSLYPVVVVVLARLVLHERLTGLQLTGVGLALTAGALLAAV